MSTGRCYGNFLCNASSQHSKIFHPCGKNRFHTRAKVVFDGSFEVYTVLSYGLFRHDKARENTAALEVLPDLLAEVDAMPPLQRLLALLQVKCLLHLSNARSCSLVF